MYAHLLSAIEADINIISDKIKKGNMPPIIPIAEHKELLAKKEQLADLAMDYINLENRYREITSKTSVY
jgi:hypothetical protein